MFEKRSDLVRFLAVTEAGTVRLAAERLAMTQPALTRVIARLEGRLGARLFERLPDGVRLTALGATVAGRARRILREFHDAETEVDAGERLPDHLRRERFLDMSAGIVAWHAHPLLEREITAGDLARAAWIDLDAPATPAPGGDGRPSLATLLDRLHETTDTEVRTIVRSGSAGLYLVAHGPYLAWLSLTFLERLPGATIRAVPVALGRYHYRSGFVARRSAEDLAPFRHFEALVRESARGARD